MSMSLYQIADYVGNKLNVPTGIIQAQLARESAWGRSWLATHYHNYGGITEWDEDSPRKFHAYNSDEEFADDYARVLSEFGVEGSQTVEDFVYRLKHQDDGREYFEDDEGNYRSGMEATVNAIGMYGSDSDGSSGYEDGFSDDDDTPMAEVSSAYNQQDFDDDLPSDMLDARYIASNHPGDEETTNTTRMLPVSLHGANLIGKWAKENGFVATLTGGAEYGYHAPGEYSHEAGWKADIVFNGITGGTKAGDAFINFCHEHGWSVNWEGDHWDIDFSGHDSRDQQPGDHSRLKDAKGSTFFGTALAASIAAGNINSWAQFLPQQDPQPELPKVPTLWEMMRQNFWDEFSSTGTASLVGHLWGALFNTDYNITQNWGKPYQVTQDDINYVKEALPGDKDSQRWILYNAYDRKNMEYLVNRKLTEQKRAVELEKWREYNSWNLQDIAVRAAGAVGGFLDPINFIPLGEAASGAKMISRIGEGITNVAKAKAIARYAAEMGLRQAVVNTFDDVLKDKYGGKKPNYVLDAAMAFIGGSAVAALGGWNAVRKQSAVMQKAFTNAESVEDTGMMHAAGVLTPEENRMVKKASEVAAEDLKKIKSETFGEASKLHDKAWSEQARKTSKIYAALEDNHKVVAMPKEKAKELVKKLSGKELPDTTDAFYVPNEDYTILLTDSPKVTANLDKVLAHETMHGGLKDALGSTEYEKAMGAIRDKLKDTTSTFYKAAQKAGTMDPEEVIGQMIEDGTLPKGGKGSLIQKMQKSINKRLEKQGFRKNTLSQSDVSDIIKDSAARARKDATEIHFNPDGSTTFAGIKFSQDNILNPRTIMATYDLEKDIPKISHGELPKPMAILAKKLETFTPFETYYTQARNSQSPTLRTLADMVFKDASMRGRVIRNAMNMEEHKQNILMRLSAPFMDYLDSRSAYLGKLKLMSSNAARKNFDEMVFRYYNAVNAGNKFGVILDKVPNEVKEAANAIMKYKRMQESIGKESSSFIGSTYKNMIDKAWYSVDDELWRNVDNDKAVAFLASFVDNGKKSASEQAREFLSKYIDKYAKRGVIKERIVRDNKVLIANTPEKKLTEAFKQAHPVNVKDISDETVEAWINQHKKGAVFQWMNGFYDTSKMARKNDSAVGRLSYLQSRIPMDTTGIMKRRIGDKVVDFSFDNDLRSFDLEHIMMGNMNRFAGESAMQAAFGSTANFDRLKKKAIKELDSAVANHALNSGKAESIKSNFRHGLYEIRGLQDPYRNDNTGILEGLSHILRGYAYMKNGANMGWNQLGEMGGSLAYGGAGQLFQIFPPLGKFVNDIRYGKELSREVAEELEPVLMGKYLESNIWGRSFEDGLISKNFNRSGSIFDFAMRHIANVTNDMGRVTSVMNLLPKTTDNMIRGMRIQSIIDSMKAANGTWSKFMTIRNPWSKAKLRAAGITDGEWSTILKGIKEHTIFSEAGRMKGLDYEAWKAADPTSFSKWVNWVQQSAERAIIDASSVGNKSILKNKGPLTQLLFQFKDFSLRTVHAQTIRAAAAHDADDFLAAALGIATNVGAYAGRAAVLVSAYEAAGMHEKAKELKERMLSNDTLIRAAITRSAILGTLPSFGNDLYESLFNVSSVRTTVDQSNNMSADKPNKPLKIKSPQDVAGRMVTQLPAVKEVINPVWALMTAHQHKEMDERYARKLLQLMPVQNWIPFTVMTEKLLKSQNLPKPKGAFKKRRAN